MNAAQWIVALTALGATLLIGVIVVQLQRLSEQTTAIDDADWAVAVSDWTVSTDDWYSAPARSVFRARRLALARGTGNRSTGIRPRYRDCTYRFRSRVADRKSWRDR